MSPAPCLMWHVASRMPHSWSSGGAAATSDTTPGDVSLQRGPLRPHDLGGAVRLKLQPPVAVLPLDGEGALYVRRRGKAGEEADHCGVRAVGDEPEPGDLSHLARRQWRPGPRRCTLAC